MEVRAGSSTRFGSLDIQYDAAVLRPRPWTLRQSAWAAELSPALPPGPILELCAGAGHIGLEAAVRTGRALVQVEIDPHAAELARRNAEGAGVVRHEVRERDLRLGLGTDERFPLILADPPYIPRDDVARFPHDPPLAIDGGPDGLSLIRTSLAVARRHVMARGVVLLQTRGKRQAHALAATLGPGLVLREVRSFDAERAIALLARG